MTDVARLRGYAVTYRTDMGLTRARAYAVIGIKSPVVSRVRAYAVISEVPTPPPSLEPGGTPVTVTTVQAG